MNVLYLDWPCFNSADILCLFYERHYHVVKFFHKDYLLHASDAFMQAAHAVLDSNDSFDFCFSFNYYPLMAQVCHDYGIKYISFTYDCPQVHLYSHSAAYPTNYIFVFDSATVNTFRSNGFTNFYYMPLPVNGTIIEHLLQEPYDKSRFTSDVSFVGSLYNERFNFFDEFALRLPEYTRGYLQGLIEAQLKIYGYYFIDEFLTNDIMDAFQQIYNYERDPDSTEPLSYVISDFYICRKMAAIERSRLLSAVASIAPLKIFTLDPTAQIPNAQNMGKVDYYSEMPYAFHDSKINLNISLRSIKNGIPLRCMDILGNGGFLLSNYQADLLLHFVPNEDFVFYESQEDLLKKVDYYLAHDEERKTIAESGHDKVKKYHNYSIIFDQILEIVFPS